MTKYSKKIDRRSRVAMEAFLETHFRYNTMNSWNNATSYAHNMKVYNLGLERDIVNKLFDLIATDDFYLRINDLIGEFGEAHNYSWQAGFNGRSGGYLVLYQGGRKPSGYKSYCCACGQKNYKSVAENGNICGVCKKPARRDFTHTHMNVYTNPGRSTDGNKDFEEWDKGALRRRVDLVCEFDALADAIVAEAVYMAENCSVEEETVYVPRTRKILVGA